MCIPSGATTTPWFTSMSGMFPTTLLVVGSITVMLSPAKFVCRMRGLFATFFAAAAQPAAHRITAPSTAARQRNAPCLPVRIFMSVSLSPVDKPYQQSF